MGLVLQFYILNYWILKTNLEKYDYKVGGLLLLVSLGFKLLELWNSDLGYKAYYLFILFKYLPQFLSGVYLCKVLTEKENFKSNSILIIICLLLNGYINEIEVGVALGIIFLLVIVSFKYDFLIINNSITRFLGGISYALYLIHQNVGFEILNYLESQISGYLLYKLILASLIIILVGFYIQKISVYIESKINF